MTDILSTIHKKMGSFSKGQKRIAQYILDDYDKAAFQTASVLGKTVQVSESTVVRFASLLGYDGYPEMQRALQEMVLNRLTSVQRIEVSAERIAQEEDILSAVLHGDAERIRTTVEDIDREAFNGAVEALLGARRIYILGVRSSAALATFLSYYFNFIFDDVRLVSCASDSQMFEQLVRISPQDALVGISFPRYSTAAIRAMEFSHNAGAHTIALTDCPGSPVAKFAEYLLCAKIDMVSLADSMVAPMSVINALIVSVASKRRKETAQIFDRLEDVWDTYHVYEKVVE